jgi:hypothetical protein
MGNSAEQVAQRDLELAALRILCQGTPRGPMLRTGARLLADYRFTDPAYEVFFAALWDTPTEDPAAIRSQLAGRINNRGFPDLELDILFVPHGLTHEQALELLRQLALKSNTASRSTAEPRQRGK